MFSRNCIMKKFIMFFLICVVIFTGCASTNQKTIKKASKNLTEYNMDIVYDNYTLDVNQNIKYINKDSAMHDKLYFHLYPNNFDAGATNKPVSSLHYDRAYPNGFSAGNITIEKVLLNGADAKYVFVGADNDFLEITLDNSISPDDKCVISMEYSVTIPNCLHRFGYGDNTINVANFYPILCVYESGEWLMEPYHSNGDPFYSSVANYNVNITYPSNLKIAHTGYDTNSSIGETTTTLCTSALAVRDYAFVLSDKFQVISGKAGDTQINYYYYDDGHASDSLQAGIDAINTFSSTFGSYPYGTFNVVKANFIHGGMEFPNLVYISDAVREKEDYLNVIIHETAHQWWYGLVGSDAYRFGWLDEGLTDYSCAVFYKANENYGVNYDALMQSTMDNYHTFVDIYTKVLGNIDTSMNRNIADYKSEAEYVYLTYVKGALLFDNISQVIGYNKLMKVLATYFDKYKFTNVTPDNFIDTLEKVSKREMRPYINSWLEGKVKL